MEVDKVEDMEADMVAESGGGDGDEKLSERNGGADADDRHTENPGKKVDEVVIIDGDSDDDDDDDSDDDDDAEGTTAEELEGLRRAVTTASGEWSYDAHAALVDKLRRACKFDELFEAREEMAKRFPLPPEAWMSWAQDLISAYGKQTPALRVLERSRGDYRSVAVELMHLGIVLDLFRKGELTVRWVRKNFEDAVSFCGLMFRDGEKIWRMYREFELELGKGSKFAANAVLSRQLRIPFWGMPEDVAYAREHARKVLEDPPCVEEMEVAVARRGPLKPLEERVASLEATLPGPGAATPELWRAWQDIIDLERREGNPTRTRIAFERAVGSCFLLAEPWVQYGRFALEVLEDGEVRLAVLRRAVRNCSWSEELWCELLRAIESCVDESLNVRRTVADAQTQLKLAGQTAVELGLGALQYYRRQVSLGRLTSSEFPVFHAAALAGEEKGSPGWCTVSLMAAKVAVVGGDASAATTILDTVTHERGQEAYWWVEYGQVLVRLGLLKEARDMYFRSTSMLLAEGELSVIAIAWLEFEAQFGTLDDYESARRCIAKQNRKLATDRQAATGGPKKRERDTGAAPASRAERRDRNPAAGSKRRPHSVPAPAPDQGAMDVVTPTAAATKADPTRTPDTDVGDQPAPAVEANTVFVSNLPFSLTKEQMRELFESIPGLKDVRLIIRQADGASRGYGYVEFDSDEGVQAALKLHRTSVSGRQIHVKRSDPSAASAPGQRYRTAAKPKKKGDRNRAGDSQRANRAGRGRDAAKNDRGRDPRTRGRFDRPHRALQVSATDLRPASLRHGGSQEPKQDQDMDVEKAPRANLKQDDFRSMLLKKG